MFLFVRRIPVFSRSWKVSIKSRDSARAGWLIWSHGPPYKIEVNYEVRSGPRRAQRTSRAERRRAGHLTPQAKTQRPENAAFNGPMVRRRRTLGRPPLNKRDKTQPALSRRRDKHSRTLTDEAWTQGPDGDRQTCAAKPHPLAPR